MQPLSSLYLSSIFLQILDGKHHIRFFLSDIKDDHLDAQALQNIDTLTEEASSKKATSEEAPSGLKRTR